MVIATNLLPRPLHEHTNDKDCTNPLDDHEIDKMLTITINNTQDLNNKLSALIGDCHFSATGHALLHVHINDEDCTSSQIILKFSPHYDSY